MGHQMLYQRIIPDTAIRYKLYGTPSSMYRYETWRREFWGQMTSHSADATMLMKVSFSDPTALAVLPICTRYSARQNWAVDVNNRELGGSECETMGWFRPG
jgi:hypothetical protein